MAEDDEIEIDLTSFLEFSKRIGLKDNDILVVKCKSGMHPAVVYQMLEKLASVFREKMKIFVTIIIVGNEIESISQIPEKEMNRLGWVRKERKGP